MYQRSMRSTSNAAFGVLSAMLLFALMLLCPFNARAHMAYAEGRLVVYSAAGLPELQALTSLFSLLADEVMCRHREIKPSQVSDVLKKEYETGVTDLLLALEPEAYVAGNEGRLLPYLTPKKRRLSPGAVGPGMEHTKVGYLVAAVHLAMPTSRPSSGRYGTWRGLADLPPARIGVVGHHLKRYLMLSRPANVSAERWCSLLDGAEQVPDLDTALRKRKGGGYSAVISTVSHFKAHSSNTEKAVSWHIPSGRPVLIPLTAAVLQGTRRPNAAIAFLSFLLERRTALLMASRLGIIPGRADLDIRLLPVWMRRFCRPRYNAPRSRADAPASYPRWQGAGPTCGSLPHSNHTRS